VQPVQSSNQRREEAIQADFGVTHINKVQSKEIMVEDSKVQPKENLVENTEAVEASNGKKKHLLF